MSKGKKTAIARIIVSLITLVVVAGLTRLGGDSARLGFILMLILVAMPWFFRGRHGEVVEDERDSLITTRADLIAALISALVATFSCVAIGMIYDPNLPMGVLRDEGGVPHIAMYWLATIWVPVYHITAGAVALVLYRQSEHAT